MHKIKQYKSSQRDPVNHSFGDGAKTNDKQSTCHPNVTDQPTEMDAVKQRLAVLEIKLKALEEKGRMKLSHERLLGQCPVVGDSSVSFDADEVDNTYSYIHITDLSLLILNLQG